MRRALVLLAALALAAPAAAQNSLSPGFTQPSEQPTTSAPTTTSASTTTSDDGGGLKTWQEVLIFLGGVILIAGIGSAIVIDARKNAPVKDGEVGHIGESRKPKPKAQTKPVRRQKARAARASRKANRR